MNDTQYTAGEIGATGTGTDTNLYINGNGTNNVIIDSSLGKIYCYNNAMNFYRGNGNRDLIAVFETNVSDINDQTFFIKGNGTNNIYIGSGIGSISLSGFGAINGNVIL